MINPSEYAKQVDMVETVSKENYLLKAENERLVKVYQLAVAETVAATNERDAIKVKNARLEKTVEEAEKALTFYAEGFETFETESLPVNDIPIGSVDISGGEAYDDNGFIAKQWLKEYGGKE